MPDEEKPSEETVTPDAAKRAPIDDAEVVETAPGHKAPEPADVEHSAPVAAKGGGRFLGLVLGGAIAAAAGYGVAQFVPQGWPAANVDALQTTISAQADEIATMKATLADLAARPAPDLSGEVSAVRAELEEKLAAIEPSSDPAPAIENLRSSVDTALASIDARLVEIEKAPLVGGGGVPSAAIAALDRDLKALSARIDGLETAGTTASGAIEDAVANAKAELAAATAEAERLRTEATAASRSAQVDAALARMSSAVEAGGPFGSALDALTQAGVEVPAALADQAEAGVPTLAELQRAFPAAARSALDAALRSDVGQGWTERLGAFLRTQTGARSLTPRDGGDPDAILSRAEAALRDGDVGLALSEVKALPESATTMMADWLARAEAREAATAALASVVSAVDGR